MRQSGTRSRHFPDPGLRIRTARGACAPRRRRCQPERASPGIRTCSRWVADPLEIGVLRNSGLRRLAEVRTIERNRRKWPAPQPFLGFLQSRLSGILENPLRAGYHSGMSRYITVPGPSTNYQHPKCYANVGSNCSKKISREHFISQKYLKHIELNDTTKIAGLSWQKPQTFSILPTKRLASNILCKRHNSALNPLDNEFGSFTNAIRDFDRGEQKSVTRTCSGQMLELWLLKCLVGLSKSKNIRASVKPECIDILFERQMWPVEWGLYYFTGSGAGTIYHTDSLSVETLGTSDGKTVLAGKFFVQGLPFFLVMGKPGNPRAFGIWHPREIVFKFPTLEKRLALSWDQAGADSVILTRAGTYDGPPPIWEEWEKKG
jgi:hypothetical protein